MSYCIGADNEVGSLRTVLVHRPGPELRRITPRTRDRLNFDGIPWAVRAQEEHDAFTEVLRDHGAEVLYVTELLQDVLEYQSARDKVISGVLADSALGDQLAAGLRGHLESLAPEDLAGVLVAGLTAQEFRMGRGLVFDLLDRHDFVIEPVPSLVFSRDSSIWIADQPIVASLPGPRRREAGLMAAIYGHHPRFAGLKPHLQPGGRYLDGGDVLLLGPGVVAVGVGLRTTPASAEHLARHLLDGGVAHTVLAVPMSQRDQAGHLDTACTVVDTAVVVMAPALSFTLMALTITSRSGEIVVSRPRPFLEAAARALDVDRLTVIDTGLDSAPQTAGQWDDGGNALAIGQRVTVCSERNVETNARLAAAGFEVITVPDGELGGARGGPRCMCAPVQRDPVIVPVADQGDGLHREPACPQPASVRPAELVPAELRHVGELTSTRLPDPRRHGSVSPSAPQRVTASAGLLP